MISECSVMCSRSVKNVSWIHVCSVLLEQKVLCFLMSVGIAVSLHQANHCSLCLDWFA